MLDKLRQLDDLLRGKNYIEPELLETSGPSISIFLPMAIGLGAIYGAFMGGFALGEKGFSGLAQLVASAVKLPALFTLTLLVTFPSLYVFSALLGSRLTPLATLRLLVSAIVVNLVVAASLATILGFFTLSTDSYSFMVILNIMILGLSGIVGLTYLRIALQRILESPASPYAPPSPPVATEGEGQDASTRPEEMPGEKTAVPAMDQPRPVDRFSDPRASDVAVLVFRVWFVIYALIGAQMAWVLRPFIGAPGLPFQVFRPRESHFFKAAFEHIGVLFSGS